MLDEPTNYLDALERGLRVYDGAVLAAGHDAVFLEAIRAWRAT
jgi:ATPase subunit of ABC transporter with duplicated ATPase domains